MAKTSTKTTNKDSYDAFFLGVLRGAIFFIMAIFVSFIPLPVPTLVFIGILLGTIVMDVLPESLK